MPDLRLHFSNRQQPDFALAPGVHRLMRQANGVVGLGDLVQGVLLAQFCLDRRGLWLQVATGMRGIHVNGRPVRRMALLRPGDAVYADGAELLVQAPSRQDRAPEAEDGHATDPRVVLRGIGGRHHGRSFTLGPVRVVGAARDADIRIDEPAFADRHATLERRGDRVLLRDLGQGDGSQVNGVKVRDAVLRAGDQVVFEGQHRFVVEFPAAGPGTALPVMEPAPQAKPQADLAASPRRAGGVRLPWLLVAALLLGAALSALLWFGAR
ncbi:FHA domain-containing protein [Xanthomonas sp. XNM01]|uniref:FHA domain-containing protein n=1 Tax=Xanthomonas sp. XNM01 TaxID=2769289 RepID=UPI001780FE27|nr:FHA domain-containing protein [Xanthomonas sp. XNM01]MBD9369186.1 FHA domain-containing protein [Xanthomonas sp. XNM01]